MHKANQFFFLSQVADHILVDFDRFDGIVMLDFCHQDDKSGDRLHTEVTRHGDHHVINYSVSHKGVEILTAKSDPIPDAMISAVLAGLVNETIPHES